MKMRHLASRLVVLALLLPMIQGCHSNGGKRTVETGISNDPISIRKPELTSSEHFSVVGEEDGDGYGNTPDGLTLFIPPEELSRYDIAKTVKDNYNYVLIRDMIVNDYEWMRREMIDLGLELDDPDEGIDTVGVASRHMIAIPDERLNEAISDPGLRTLAKEVLQMYNDFDGREDSDGVLFVKTKEWESFSDNLVPISSPETLEKFEDWFWSWYDKGKYVPEIDSLMTRRFEAGMLPGMSEEESSRFLELVKSEKDIDRRTILAIELAPYVPSEAVLLMGEILESGIYTKYILEAYLNWRAMAQEQYFGSSSMSLIPNNLYNQVRARCVETILRHYIQSGEEFDLCLIDNLIGCGVLARFGWIMGNGATPALYNLRERAFLPPEILGYDYLEKKTDTK